MKGRNNCAIHHQYMAEPRSWSIQYKEHSQTVYTRTKQATLLKPTSATTGLQGWLTERKEDKEEEGEERRGEERRRGEKGRDVSVD